MSVNLRYKAKLLAIFIITVVTTSCKVKRFEFVAACNEQNNSFIQNNDQYDQQTVQRILAVLKKTFYYRNNRTANRNHRSKKYRGPGSIALV